MLPPRASRCTATLPASPTRIALGITLVLRFVADTFFAKRYGHRAIVLETVAAVPGMVGGMLVHLRCLRWMIDDDGWIRTLLDEAENERMHLMTFVHIAKPNWFERVVILLAQAVFFVFFFGAVPGLVAHGASPGRLLRGAGGDQLHAVPGRDRRRAASTTSPRRPLPSTTGTWRRTRGCATSCWPCVPTKPGTGT